MTSCSPLKRVVSHEELLSALVREKLSRQSLQATYDWAMQARENQKIPTGKWLIWLIMAGRGFGKTRVGSETVRLWVDQGYRRIALIGETQSEARHVMVEGVSGILSVFPPSFRPIYEPSKRQLTWPNGAIAQIFSADNSEQMRGSQFDAAWIDEFAKFSHPQALFDQLMFCLRIGQCPRMVITTTPRPLNVLRTMVKRSDCILTRGSTFDNREHLSPDFLTAIEESYGRTRLGAQELRGELLDECDEALWRQTDFLYVLPECRPQFAPKFVRQRIQKLVIAVDPAVSQSESSDETGIMLIGLGFDQKAYVIADYSMKAKVGQWAPFVVDLAKTYEVDKVIAEVNQGGDLVGSVLKSYRLTRPFVAVRAIRDKASRALPVSLYYQQNRVYHLEPFVELESQLCGYVPSGHVKSPDRMDALVWGITDIFDRREQQLPAQIWFA